MATPTTDTIKCYTDLVEHGSFIDRFEYLKLSIPENDPFEKDRYLKQALYRTPQWQKARREVLIRDNGCEFGLEDYPISGEVMIHHMNPVTIDDIINQSDTLFNTEFLISVSRQTHTAIHYGSATLLPSYDLVERFPNDTCPWKQVGENSK